MSAKWQSDVALMLSCLPNFSATKPAPHAVLLRRRRRSDGRPTGSVPARREFLARIIPSYIDDVVAQERTSFHAASLLVARRVVASLRDLDPNTRAWLENFIVGPHPQPGASVKDGDVIHLFAHRLRQYYDYDAKHPY
jgi:hypothetical protein